MTARDLLGYAAGALSGHRLRTGLSLTGVAIGIAAVVLLTALGEGARRYVLEQFAQIGSNFVAVVPGRTETTGAFPGMGGTPNDLTLEDVRALRRALPEVRHVEPLVVGTETVARGERRRQVLVVGATADFAELRRLTLARGRFLPRTELDRGGSAVVLGDRVARELFPPAEGVDPVGGVVRIGGLRCRVIGVLRAKGQQVGMNIDDTAIVPVATGMRLFDRSSLFRILIEAPSTAALDRIVERAEAVIVARHGELDVTLITEQAIVDSLSAILGVLTLALGAIAAVSLGVAGLGIMNVLLVAVSERTAEIGLLRAVGASRGQVRLCFLAEAALLSSAGGVVGLAVGMLGVRTLVAVWPALPAAPPAWAIAASAVLAVAVGSVFGWLPARRASALDPVEALARGRG